MTHGKYHKGTISISDTKWKVFTVSKDGKSFVFLGEIFVSGKIVGDEMDACRSIKGHEPHDVAWRMASEKFLNENPIIVEQIYN